MEFHEECNHDNHKDAKTRRTHHDDDNDNEEKHAKNHARAPYLCFQILKTMMSSRKCIFIGASVDPLFSAPAGAGGRPRENKDRGQRGIPNIRGPRGIPNHSTNHWLQWTTVYPPELYPAGSKVVKDEKKAPTMIGGSCRRRRPVFLYFFFPSSILVSRVVCHARYNT